MNRPLRWSDHILLNIYWLGLNVASGTITPVLLPYLVALFVPPEQKNTYLGLVRVIGLAVAMLVQPMAGMFSDRCTSRWGRRRPYIFAGTLLDLVFLAIIGASPLFLHSALDGFFLSTLGITTALFVLIVGIVFLQASSNIAHGALQGLIPDRVPEDQRGRSSGVKAVMELLPVFLVMVTGPLVDRGLVGWVVGFVGLALLATMLATVLGVREEPLREQPTEPVGERVWRLVALTAIFVLVTRGALGLVNTIGGVTAGAALGTRVAVGILVGLLAMAGSIFLGVYFGAWVGIGREAPRQTSFIWWVVNRLMFLAAVGSVQGFAQYFLRDVLHIPNAATMTTILLAVVAVFLLPAALGGGYLADRVGRKRLVIGAGLVAGAGTVLLLFSTNIPLVLVSGCIIGLGTGIFYAANWALGTDLAPPAEAGRYLGISNLAGAGAGIVGAGIGGPMADYFNALQPGLGYLVIFAVYAALFFLSVAALTRVRVGH
ncbi:MAG: MFS transporter [Anaerolineae bacterium]|nr:MFS transporter [Anaerolineae bacterium]MDW8067474.1 MFS transporter [Anaerolineae bacterium]